MSQFPTGASAPPSAPLPVTLPAFKCKGGETGTVVPPVSTYGTVIGAGINLGTRTASPGMCPQFATEKGQQFDPSGFHEYGMFGGPAGAPNTDVRCGYLVDPFHDLSKKYPGVPPGAKTISFPNVTGVDGWQPLPAGAVLPFVPMKAPTSSTGGGQSKQQLADQICSEVQQLAKM